MKWLSLAATRRATFAATADATGFAARYATGYATRVATRIPDHPTTDHITALLRKAKELAR